MKKSGTLWILSILFLTCACSSQAKTEDPNVPESYGFVNNELFSSVKSDIADDPELHHRAKRILKIQDRVLADRV